MAETAVFRGVLLGAFLISIMHYTDNYVRFDEYPNDLPDLVTKESIPTAWVVFTVFALAAYVLYERGERRRAGVCLAVYSVSGLIGPLHYTSGALSEFDAFQHVNIALDVVAGVACLLTAVWVLAKKPAGAAVVASSS
jgi:hypothetical protein